MAEEWFPSASTYVSVDGEEPRMVTLVHTDDGVVQLADGRWVAISKCAQVPAPEPSHPREAEREPSADVKRLNPFLDHEAKRPDEPDEEASATQHYGARGMLAPPAVIRAAEGVTLKAGSRYAIAEIADWDHNPSHALGDVVDCSHRNPGSDHALGTLGDSIIDHSSGACWLASLADDTGGATYVTAVRRVEAAAEPVVEMVSGQRSREVCEFAQQILHGDHMHRVSLVTAAEDFVAGRPVSAPVSEPVVQPEPDFGQIAVQAILAFVRGRTCNPDVVRLELLGLTAALDKCEAEWRAHHGVAEPVVQQGGEVERLTKERDELRDANLELEANCESRLAEFQGQCAEIVALRAKLSRSQEVERGLRGELQKLGVAVCMQAGEIQECTERFARIQYHAGFVRKPPVATEATPDGADWKPNAT